MRRPTPALRPTHLPPLALCALLAGVAPACDYSDPLPATHEAADTRSATDVPASPDAPGGDVDRDASVEPEVGGDTTAPPPDPRRPDHVVLRRLNRTEWANSVRDLLGAHLDLAKDFPADDLGYGFDNIASVLTLSPLHMELYERAAGVLAHAALTPPVVAAVELRVEAETALSDDPYGSVHGNFYVLGSGGTLSGEVDVTYPGHYIFEVRAFEQHAGDENALVVFTLDGVSVGSARVTAPNAASAALYPIEVDLTSGRHTLGATFANDFYAPPADRNLAIDYLALRGPSVLQVLSDTMWGHIVPCEIGTLVGGDVACADTLVSTLAARAWRRPVTTLEHDALMGFFEDARAAGTPFLEALELPVRAIFLAPHFLFKVELPAGTGPLAAPELLSGYELATRLSYFLWSSTPDDILIAAAKNGELGTVQGISQQVARMLGDARADALIDDFASEWLYVRDIANVFPDQTAFPDFDESLRASMIEELRRFLGTFLHSDRSLLELLTASDTFIDARLAAHYGLEMTAPAADGWQAVELAEVPRRGVLGKAGLMTALSTPFRTSIVRRGKWVLGQLLCSEPRPPPVDVPSLPAMGTPASHTTLRAMMEAHKAEDRCRNCHKAMDPIGFALENYDGIGAWRTTDNGYAIDANGEFSDGTTFDGPVALSQVLAADTRLPACMVEKLLTYALGRGMRPADEAVLAKLGQDFAAAGYTFPALIELIATSDPFRYRGVPEAGTEASP